MPFTVVVKEEALGDIIEAYNYYESKRPGLGERFLEALQQRYRHLATNPALYGLIDNDPLKVLRDVKLNKFPFVIVYEIIQNDVVIFAVHNTHNIHETS